VLAILNLTPEPRLNYRIGLPTGGFWKELINSDSSVYGGSNMGNLGGIQAQQEPAHRLPFSGEFLLPPLSLTAFQSED
jgi:1,4-alpha-glucan branching enzyme